MCYLVTTIYSNDYNIKCLVCDSLATKQMEFELIDNSGHGVYNVCNQHCSDDAFWLLKQENECHFKRVSNLCQRK